MLVFRKDRAFRTAPRQALLARLFTCHLLLAFVLFLFSSSTSTSTHHPAAFHQDQQFTQLSANMISIMLLLVASASLLTRITNAEKHLPDLTFADSCTPDQRSTMQDAHQLATDQLDLVLSFKDGRAPVNFTGPFHISPRDAQDLRTRYFGKMNTSESLFVSGKPPSPSTSRPAYSALAHTSKILAY